MFDLSAARVTINEFASIIIDFECLLLKCGVNNRRNFD